MQEYGNVLREMKSGEVFGEKALTENAPRSASILCKTNCVYIILEKKAF